MLIRGQKTIIGQHRSPPLLHHKIGIFFIGYNIFNKYLQTQGKYFQAQGKKL